MKNDKSQFVVRTSDSYLLSSIVIGHLTHRRLYLGGREKKCIAGFQPAKVVLTQKELSRLRCRRDAGATIFSHDPCLRGEKPSAVRLRDLTIPQPVSLPPGPIGLSRWGKTKISKSGRVACRLPHQVVRVLTVGRIGMYKPP